MQDSKEKLILAARKLYETKGIASTSVKDIAEKAQITRSLFYHYFANKAAITSAVLDSYIDDFVDVARNWFENRRAGDVEYTLRQLIGVMRRCIFDTSLFRKNLASTEHASLYIEFMHRSSEVLSVYLNEIVITEYARHQPLKIRYVPESLYILLTGLVAYIKYNPSVKDEVLVQIIAQFLHLNLNDDHLIG